jgi:hypothetical protein
MPSDWDRLSEQSQLELSQAALVRAVETIAGHAECLAREMEGGGLMDRGGPDALRLLASVIRVTGRTALPHAAGHA